MRNTQAKEKTRTTQQNHNHDGASEGAAAADQTGKTFEGGSAGLKDMEDRYATTNGEH